MDTYKIGYDNKSTNRGTTVGAQSN